MSAPSIPVAWSDVQWAASGLGVVGALTNSLGGRVLRLTWPIWMCSNLLAIMVLWHLGAFGLLAQQVFYLLTSVLGGIRAFFPGHWNRLRWNVRCVAGMGWRAVRASMPTARTHQKRPVDFRDWLKEVDRLAWENLAERDYTLRHGASEGSSFWADAWLAGLTPAAAWDGEVRAARIEHLHGSTCSTRRI